MDRELDSIAHRRFQSLPWAIRIPFLLAVFSFFAGGIGAIFAQSTQFVVSPAWQDAAKLPAIVWGIATACAFAWIILDRRKAEIALNGGYDGSVRTFFVSTLGSAMAGHLAFFAVIEVIPMTAATFSSQQSEIAVTVAKTNLRDGKCRNGVEFEESSFLQKLCGLPADLVRDLQPGDHVRLSGRGTWMGLWVAGANRRSDG